MAKYFSLSNATFADDFKAALEAYYGDGVTIESASGKTITFQCPAVCDKALKFVSVSNGTFNAYANNTQFSRSYNGSATNFNLILADAFILVDAIVTNGYNNSALVAKLTNGRYMVAGGTTTMQNTYSSYNKCFFTDTMVLRPIRMALLHGQTLRTNGKMCLFPSIVADDTELELNADGTLATIPGLSVATTTGAPVVGNNFYLSLSNLNGLPDEGCYCYSQKYVELEME